MAYGIKMFNTSNELTISSDARTPFCVGRMVLQSTQQPAGVARTNEGRVSGFSVYRISNAPGPIMVAFDLPVGYCVGVSKIVNVGTNMWDAYIYCGSGAGDSDGFQSQSPIDVWAYAFSSSLTDTRGIALYDKNGVLTTDLSRPFLLFPASYVAGGVPDEVTNIATLVRPVAMGNANIERLTREAYVGVGGTSLNTVKTGYWKRTGNTTVTIQLVPTYMFVSEGDGGFALSSDVSPMFLIEGSALP